MSEIKKILEEQLEREKASAKKDLNMILMELCTGLLKESREIHIN